MNHGTSRLYALKKTTPEGPAISSAVMHGKPLVAYVSFTYPRSFPDTEPVPMFVFLTSEARQLWCRFTTEIVGRRTAIVMDGLVIQDWQVMCGIENGKFMIRENGRRGRNWMRSANNWCVSRDGDTPSLQLQIQTRLKRHEKLNKTCLMVIIPF